MPRTFVDKMRYHAVLQCLLFGVLVVMAVLLVCVRVCLWLLLVGGCDWLVGVEFGWCVCWGWRVPFEMKRAGDLFPNHPKERTDSVRQ